jgi:hypothetical protein
VEKNERQRLILDTLKPFERALREHIAARHAAAAALDSDNKARREAFVRASEGGEIQAKLRGVMHRLLRQEDLL